jgi:hypothetical protein
MQGSGPPGIRLAACGSWAIAKLAQEGEGLMQAVKGMSARINACAPAIM